MKASNYNIFVEFPERKEIILFNSLYGSISTWNKNEINIIEGILANPDQYKSKYANIKSVLLRQKNLIADSLDEIAIIKNRKIMGIKDENRLDVIIMPTLQCNFACKYCYETSYPSKMDSRAEESIKRWLAIQIPRFKVLMFHWYGGEPLLAYRRIISISQHIRKIADRSGVFWVIHITTNGYLLNKERIEGLINSGIYDYQITLDGTPEYHNKMRVLKNGRSTFSRIFQNINALARADRRVKISLRVNFNHTNFHSIPLLLKMFPEDIRPHLRVVFEPIFGDCQVSAMKNIEHKEISDNLADYYDMARSLGYDVVFGLSSVNSGKLLYCYAERENQFIISYNADVFKCSVSDFSSEKRVGYIREDGQFIKEDEWYRWMNLELFGEQCISCKYLPLCMGGCHKVRLEEGRPGSYCALLPASIEYMLRQIVSARLNKGVERTSLNK